MLEVQELQVHFHTGRGVVKAVDGASFAVNRGEVLGLVGESGCGKSVAALAILGIVAYPGRVAGGKVLLDGQDLTQESESSLESVRGGRIGIVFQDPMTALNPSIHIGEQVAEVVRAHTGKAGLARSARLLGRAGTKSAGWRRAMEVLQEVGIPAAEKRAFDYPHEFSGGLRQRVVIGSALTSRPELVIADEPTTALDVTVQAQILELMISLKNDYNTGILLITHDLGVVAQTCDRAAVMYAGHIVEDGPVGYVVNNPLHPYTQALLRCVPSALPEGQLPEGIPGTLPDPTYLPVGCRFQPRCQSAREGCARPQSCRKVGDRNVRCLLYD